MAGKLKQKGDIFYNILDPVTGSPMSVKKQTTLPDGSPISDSDVDGRVVVKLGASYGGGYAVKTFDEGQTKTLVIDTVDRLRNLTQAEILMLRLGIYEDVELTGYYVKGDTPAPIKYKLSDTTDPDDGGSVFAVGGIKLEHDFKEGANLAYFGLQDGDDIFDAYDTAQLKYTKILIPQGHYYTSMTLPLKTNFEVLNVGDVTIESTGVPVIMKTPNYTIQELTQTVDLPTGSVSTQIPGHNLEAGDIIIFRSTNRFTRDWDGGEAIRDYYLDAELFKVDSVSGDTVTLDNPSYLNFPVADATPIYTFKPETNIILGDFTFIQTVDSGDTETSALMIKGATSVKVGNIKTRNTGIYGIAVDASYDVDVKSLNALGTQFSTTTNYGLAVTNGSKFVNIDNLTGSRCRHILAGGGDGTAISMYVNVNNVFTRNSLSHSIDGHGNTAFYTIKSANVDNFYSLSGIGHRVDSIKSMWCKQSFIAFEGGKDLSLGSAYIYSADNIRISNQIHNLSIDYLNINMKNIYTGPSFFNFFVLPEGSKGLNIGYMSIKNLDFDPTQSADANFTIAGSKTLPAVRLRDDSKVGKLHIEGFYRGLMIEGNNIAVDTVSVKNTGWTSASMSLGYMININRGSDEVSIGGGTLDNSDISSYSNPNTAVVRAGGGTNVNNVSGPTITNIKYKGGAVGTRMEVHNSFLTPSIINNQLGNTGSVNVVNSQSGIVIGNDFIEDTYLKASRAEASPDTAPAPGSTYSQTEVQSILDELRDLKNKMRDAGILDS